MVAVPLLTEISAATLIALEAELSSSVAADSSKLLPREVRRRRGAYFTPPPLARYVAERVLAPLLVKATWRTHTPRLRVLDPSAGDGAFLRAACDVIVQAAVERGAPCGDSLTRAVARDCLFAIERDADEASRLTAAWPELTVWTADALLSPPTNLGTVDAVVTNPPYRRSIHIRAEEPEVWSALRGRFAATSFGEWDLYGAFIEQAVTWLRPGARAGLVVPSRWLTSRSAGPLRAHLLDAVVVRELIDFGDARMFGGATTYSSIVILDRTPSTKPIVTATREGARQWQVGTLSPPDNAASPWILRRQTVVSKWPQGGPTLEIVAQLVKGAGTNADRVFLISDAIVDGDSVSGTVYGEEVEVERAATLACVRGRDVVAWGALNPQSRCITPYVLDDTGAAKAVGLAAFSARFPKAAAVLLRHRHVLEARERGRFVGDDCIKFGRPQNLALHLGPLTRVVVPDVVAAPRAMLAPGETLAIDSAYAAFPRRESGAYGDPYFLMALLSSPVMGAWLAQHSVPLRGGYTRMKSAVLSPLPLPGKASLVQAIAEVARLGDRVQAEAMLLAAYRG